MHVQGWCTLIEVKLGYDFPGNTFFRVNMVEIFFFFAVRMCNVWNMWYFAFIWFHLPLRRTETPLNRVLKCATVCSIKCRQLLLPCFALYTMSSRRLWLSAGCIAMVVCEGSLTWKHMAPEVCLKRTAQTSFNVVANSRNAFSICGDSSCNELPTWSPRDSLQREKSYELAFQRVGVTLRVSTFVKGREQLCKFSFSLLVNAV